MFGKKHKTKGEKKENSDVRLVQKSLSNGQLMYWLEPRRHGSCKEINGAPAFAKRERKKNACGDVPEPRINCWKNMHACTSTGSVRRINMQLIAKC